MNLTTTYGDLYVLGAAHDVYGRAGASTIGIIAPDQVRYRFRIRAATYTGDAYAVQVYRGGFRVRWGAPVAGPTDVLRPVLPMTIELSLVDHPTFQGPGRFGGIVGLADGALQCVVEEANDATTPTAWTPLAIGYLAQESLLDSPTRGGAVRLTFHDSLRFLLKQPFVGTGAIASRTGRVLDDFARCIGPLGGAVNTSFNGAGWEGVKSCSNWRPFRPGGTADQITGTQDPLWYLKSLQTAWTDEDGASVDALEGVRALSARFGCRLVQSEGYWWILQRDYLAASPTGPKVWTYPASTSGTGAFWGIETAAPPTMTTPNLVKDTKAWVQDVGALRETMLPVKSIESAYNFEGVLENVVLNPSFEEEGTGGTTKAKYWVQSTGANRIPADSSGWPFPVTYNDEYILQINGASGGNEQTAVQSGYVYLPASAGWSLHVSYAFGLLAPIPGSLTQNGGILFKIGDYGLVRATASVVIDSRPGSPAKVWVEPLLNGVSGAAAGTPVIPAGVTLYGFSGDDHVATLTTTKEARIGGRVLEGDLDADVHEGDTFTFYYWASGVTQWLHGSGSVQVDAWLAMGAASIFATGYAKGGEIVSGTVSTTLYGPTGIGAAVAFDDVIISLRMEGSEPDTVSAVVTKGAGSPGLEESIPAGDAASEHPVGDGPLPDSQTGLTTLVADEQPTYQGSSTGWKAGAYGAGDPTTAQGLEDFSARRALLQLNGYVAAGDTGGGLERFLTRFQYASASQRLLPQHVPKYWQKTTIEGQVVGGEDRVNLRARVAPGQSVTLGVGKATEETLTVSTCTRGTGSYAVVFTGTIANTHPVGEGALYSYYAAPDLIDWTLDTAEADVEGTELALAADEAEYITELRLGN